jgi:hypothetical protein
LLFVAGESPTRHEGAEERGKLGRGQHPVDHTLSEARLRRKVRVQVQPVRPARPSELVGQGCAGQGRRAGQTGRADGLESPLTAAKARTSASLNARVSCAYCATRSRPSSGREIMG